MKYVRKSKMIAISETLEKKGMKGKGMEDRRKERVGSGIYSKTNPFMEMSESHTILFRIGGEESRRGLKKLK